MQICKVKYYFDNLNMPKEYWTRPKKFEHGQNMFELADLIGISVNFLLINYFFGEINMI